MNIDPYIFSFSAVTVFVTVWMGFWSARKSTTASDFFVAGRSVSVGWNASAISGEYLSAASFMGIAGMVMSSGYDALWYPVCYACGYLFLLLFIAGPLRRFGAYTIPDFAEGRFDSPVFRKIAVVFVLFIGFFYTMPQMKGAGTTLNYIFPKLPYWAGVTLIGAVITLNVALGGMKGITLVQACQYWMKMFAISVPIFVLMAVYGSYGKQVGLNGGGVTDPALRKPMPAKAPADAAWLNPFGPLSSKAAKAAKPHVEFKGALETIDYGSPGKALAMNLTRPLIEKLRGVEVNIPPGQYSALEMAVFWANSKQPASLQTAPALTNVMVRWDATTAMAPAEFRQKVVDALGTNGVTLVSESAGVAKAFPTAQAVITPVNSKPYALLYTYSLIIAIVCGTAGLPHILVRFYTNPDGVAAKRTTMWVMILIGVFYVFPPVFGVIGRNLLPDLYAASGVKGTDKVVLELPKIVSAVDKGVLGSILSGITCAGAFAAFMSTFSGLLVSMTGALAHDVYGRILRPKSTPMERMRAFKICAVIIGAVSILLGTQVEQLQINFMVGQAFAIAAASYFPLLFMSVWWRGMTMKGAATGMLGGGMAALACTTVINLSDLKKIDITDFWASHPLARILCEQPAIWTVPLAILLMVIVSKLTRAQVPADIRMKMLVLHAPEKLGLKQEYIQEHQGGH